MVFISNRLYLNIKLLEKKWLVEVKNFYAENNTNS